LSLVTAGALTIGAYEPTNGVCEPLFVKQHPRPGELIAARDLDLDRVCIAPVWSSAVTRGDYYSMSERDLDLESGHARSARPRERVLTTGELVVDERDGRLEVCTRDGAHRFDIIAFFEHHLIADRQILVVGELGVAAGNLVRHPAQAQAGRSGR